MAQNGDTKPIVVGLWRRWAADFLDALLLAVLGWMLAYPFRYALSDLGKSAAWIGLVISLLYAGLLHTQVGEGQTLGKRALGIQVLRRDGSYLSWRRSLARYLVVSFVFYNQMYGSLLAQVPSANVAQAIGAGFLLIVAWVFLACFLMIPLHPLKRGLHDLASDSVVVYKGRYDGAALDELEKPARVRKLLGLMGVAAALAVGLLFWQLKTLANNSTLESLQALQTELSTHYPEVSVSQVTSNSKTRTLFVNLWLPLRRYDDVTERERVRQEALDRAKAVLPAALEVDQIKVRIGSGYDLGIVRSNASS